MSTATVTQITVSADFRFDRVQLGTTATHHIVAPLGTLTAGQKLDVYIPRTGHTQSVTITAVYDQDDHQIAMFVKTGAPHSPRRGHDQCMSLGCCSPTCPAGEATGCTLHPHYHH